MADLSRTVANTKPGAGANIKSSGVTYGGTVSQGDPLYISTTDGYYYPTDANDTAVKSVAVAMAVTPGTTGGPGIIVQPGSLIDLGATLTVGMIYCVSTTVGGVTEVGNLASGHYVSVLGIATTTALMYFDPICSSVQKP